jgi:hypothetical protein
MTTRTPRTPPRYRCRFCGVTFSACPGLKLSGADGATLLHHVAQSHPAEPKPFLDQMHTDDDITPVILQAYDVVEGPL